MKNKIILFLSAFIIICFTASCSKKQATKKTEGEAKATIASLKPRTGELAKTEEWPLVQEKYKTLTQKISDNPGDIKSKLLLAQLFMQEARITGEHPYYYPATLVVLNDILKQEPKSFEALAFKSSVMLSLHHFSEALEVGTIAKEVNSNNAFIFGVLCDANVELGNYEEAVKMSDRMQSIRPGLEAYSRASYLREIYGNNAAAIDAMKMAYKAGLPGSEEASWAGYTLASLYENTGDLKNAEDMYNTILTLRPSYAFAVAGLGRIETAKGNYDKAIEHFERAAQMMPEYSFYEDMAEAYAAKGDIQKSKELYTEIITMLSEDAASGHYADMDLALSYIKTGDLKNALKHAQTEYERRPQNIDANATLAWVLYHRGDYAGAQKHIQTATRMGKQNAVLLCKAGIIEIAAGNEKAGMELISRAKKINPHLPSDLKEKITNRPS